MKNNWIANSLKKTCFARRISFPAKLALMLLVIGVSGSAMAQYAYTTNADNTLTITGYSGSGGAVTIPASIGGRAVTDIGLMAFYDCDSLTHVTIPVGVKSIGTSAFSLCSNLRGVTIPASVVTIEGDAFYYCESLTNVTIPAGVTRIEGNTFAHCSGLTSITLGSGVTNIDVYAFAYCSGLTTIAIPKSVKSIGQWTFYSCSSLNAITVDSLNTVYSSESGVLFNKNKTTLIQCPGGKTGSYTIPGSVTAIGPAAFAGCSGLASVVIPNSVTLIGAGAFNTCTGLTSVMIGNGVARIEGSAFASCSGLTTLTFPASLTYIGGAVFSFCGDGLREFYFKGNAPVKANSTIYDASPDVVYYVPGTTGWGSTFAGWPTAVWNQTNLVLNSSFETGGTAPASWIRGGSAVGSSAAAHNGTNSLRIAAAGVNAPTKQTIAIKAGTTYDISVWINAAGLTAGPAIFDTGDKYDGAGQGQFVISSANSGWTKYSGKFTATNTSVTLRMFTESGFRGTVCFDNIVLAPSIELPSPWQTKDISTVGRSGGTTYNNGTYTLKGAGKRVGDVSDSYHYVHQVSSGDCDIKVKVLSLTNTASAAKSGVAIRETLNGNARAAGVWVTPTNGIIFTARTSTGAVTTNKVTTGKKAPYWVRLTRTGNSFKAYYGTTGTNWTQLGSTTTINMTTNAYIGMGLCSGDTNKLATSVISNVTATP